MRGFTLVCMTPTPSVVVLPFLWYKTDPNTEKDIITTLYHHIKQEGDITF